VHANTCMYTGHNVFPLSSGSLFKVWMSHVMPLLVDFFSGGDIFIHDFKKYPGFLSLSILSL